MNPVCWVSILLHLHVPFCANNHCIDSLPSCNLYLEASHASNKGGKARKSLLATPAHSNQHGTASWLHQDPRNATDVLHGVLE